MDLPKSGFVVFPPVSSGLPGGGKMDPSRFMFIASPNNYTNSDSLAKINLRRWVLRTRSVLVLFVAFRSAKSRLLFSRSWTSENLAPQSLQVLRNVRIRKLNQIRLLHPSQSAPKKGTDPLAVEGWEVWRATSGYFSKKIGLVTTNRKRSFAR